MRIHTPVSLGDPSVYTLIIPSKRLLQQDWNAKLVKNQLLFWLQTFFSLLSPSPPIVIGGRGPEALFHRLEVRQRRGRTAAPDGLGQRPLGTEVGRRQRGVDDALETVLGATFTII